MQVSQNLTPPSSMRSCGTISGCSGAFSAIPCANRKGGRCSISSNASGKLRSASIATTTSRRGARWRPSSTACRPVRRVQVVRAFSYFSHLANIAEDQITFAECAASPRRRQCRAREPRPHDRPCPEGRISARAELELFSTSTGQSGADGAPDGSAAQEHTRS